MSGDGGAEAVLGTGVPCRELLTAAAALRLYAGDGAVRLGAGVERHSGVTVRR